MSKNKKKIFVFGIARSGTTLVQQLLSSHSQLVGINETEILKRWRRWPMKTVDAFLKRQAYTDKEYQLVSSFIATKVPLNTPRKDVSVFDVLVWYGEAFVQAYKAEGFSEKTPIHSLFIQAIMTNITDASGVVVLRDPRAVVASRLHTKRISRGKEWGAPKWLQFYLNLSEVNFTYRFLLQAMAKDERLVVIRYEDLMLTPQETVAHLCLKLGIAIEPLHHAIAPRDDRFLFRHKKAMMNSSFGAQPSTTIVPKPLDGWKERLTTKQIALINSVCVSLLPTMVSRYYPQIQATKRSSMIFKVFSWFDAKMFLYKNMRVLSLGDLSEK